jgi:hypothetical protein
MSGRLKNFLAAPLRPVIEKTPIFAHKPTRVTKGGLNVHQSNRAKEGESAPHIGLFAAFIQLLGVTIDSVIRIVPWQGCYVWTKHISLAH